MQGHAKVKLQTLVEKRESADAVLEGLRAELQQEQIKERQAKEQARKSVGEARATFQALDQLRGHDKGGIFWQLGRHQRSQRSLLAPIPSPISSSSGTGLVRQKSSRDLSPEAWRQAARSQSPSQRCRSPRDSQVRSPRVSLSSCGSSGRISTAGLSQSASSSRMRRSNSGDVRSQRSLVLDHSSALARSSAKAGRSCANPGSPTGGTRGSGKEVVASSRFEFPIEASSFQLEKQAANSRSARSILAGSSSRADLSPVAVSPSRRVGFEPPLNAHSASNVLVVPPTPFSERIELEAKLAALSPEDLQLLLRALPRERVEDALGQ